MQLRTTCKAVKYRNNIINIIHNLLCFLYLWIASVLIIVTSLKKVIINFNELCLNCYPLCILIYVNIKKLNLFLNNNLLENNGKNICDLLKRLVMFSKMSLFFSVMYTIMYINTSLINSLLTNNIIQLYHVIFKYYISSIFKDIIICSVCKTLYLYVSSAYTVMWHAIIMPSYMSKYLIKDPLQKKLNTYSILYGQTNPMHTNQYKLSTINTQCTVYCVPCNRLE